MLLHLSEISTCLEIALLTSTWSSTLWNPRYLHQTCIRFLCRFSCILLPCLLLATTMAFFWFFHLFFSFIIVFPSYWLLSFDYIICLFKLKILLTYQIPRSDVSIEKDKKKNQLQIQEEWFLLSDLVFRKDFSR